MPADRDLIAALANMLMRGTEPHPGYLSKEMPQNVLRPPDPSTMGWYPWLQEMGIMEDPSRRPPRFFGGQSASTRADLYGQKQQYPNPGVWEHGDYIHRPLDLYKDDWRRD